VTAPSDLLDAARKLQPRLVDLRRRIHAEPELGLELPETRRKVLAALEGLPLEIRLHEGTSGVVARLRGGRPGPAVLLRGDMDALPMPEDTELPFRSKRPGAMHACGHDAHTAMLVGAAHLLAQCREELAGDVLFMFQPGEEGQAGALRMLEEGLLEEGEEAPAVAAAFALHVAPQLPCGAIATRPGALMASADVFEIELRGRGGHASMPHDCLDPLPAACEIVQALQTFVTRRIPATDPVVLTVTRLQAGTTSNVIPESAQLTGTLRALSERSRQQAQQGLAQVAEGVARAHGVEAKFQLLPGYPVTVNHEPMAALLLEVGRQLLGEPSAIQLPSPVMGAEDFSYLLQKVPGAMAFLGVRPPGASDPAPCHSNRMQLNEDALPWGVAFHAAVALHALGQLAAGSRAAR